jgi:hypothetical protein
VSERQGGDRRPHERTRDDVDYRFGTVITAIGDRTATLSDGSEIEADLIAGARVGDAGYGPGPAVGGGTSLAASGPPDQLRRRTGGDARRAHPVLDE